MSERERPTTQPLLALVKPTTKLDDPELAALRERAGRLSIRIHKRGSDYELVHPDGIITGTPDIAGVNWQLLVAEGKAAWGMPRGEENAHDLREAVTERAIADIRIGQRHRRDLGDVNELAASIAAVGLLHPVVIEPDGKLIAGQRRLEAYKQLGWTEIPVTVVALDNIVRGEFAENTARKDFTLSEAVAIKRALEPVEKAAAKTRMLAGRPSGKLPKGRAGDKAAKATGHARRTLEKAEAVVAAAEAEPERLASCSLTWTAPAAPMVSFGG